MRLRIGITQRLDSVPDRIEQRDALDQRWASFLWSLGYVALPLSSGHEDVSAYLSELALDGFVLSGGNDVGAVPLRDRLEAGILALAATRTLPVLGVCRGLQFINTFQGGVAKRVQAHARTRHIILGPLTTYRGNVVNSYHDWGVFQDGLGKDLTPIAWAFDGCIEALRHKHLPWLGILWHPERESPPHADDCAIIRSLFQTGRICVP